MLTGTALLAAALALPRYAAAGPLRCPGGRFLITDGGPLLADVAGGGAQLLVAEAGNASFAGACRFDSVTLQAHKRFTLVRARARTCGNARRVALIGRIGAPGCTELRGVLRARKTPARTFDATLSVCGDGRYDDGGEACDAGLGCAEDEACDEHCLCVPTGGTATTTTTVAGATTTTSPGGTTTTLDGGTATTSTSTSTSMPGTSTTVPADNCHVFDVPTEPGPHVPVGTPITYDANPPASGPHYAVWAKYEDYAVAVPRGYWVHNLEHGAVVIVYRPDAPPEFIAALHADYQAVPDDATCPNATRRTLMTPDPLIPMPFAVIVRNKVMRCVVPERAALLSFVSQFRGRTGGEHNCSEGGYG